MVTGSAIVSVVTLYLSGVHFDDQFSPAYTSDSIYYYKNASENGVGYRAIKADAIPNFDGLAFFPKCCHPGYVYENANRECLKSNHTSIYDELNLKTDLIRSALEDCSVIVDRYVEKGNVRRFAGIGYLLVEDESFTQGQFCLDNVVQSDNFYVVRLCEEKDFCVSGSGNETRDWCIRKCCPDGFGFQDYKCTRMQHTGLRVELNRDYYEQTDGYALYHSSSLKCSIANWHEYQEVNFTIKSNGTLFKYGDGAQYGEDEYCVDVMYNTDKKSLADMVILCEYDNSIHFKWNFIRTVVILTCLCFMVTIGVYAFYDKPQRLIIIGFCIVDLIFWTMYAMRIFYVNFDGFCTIFGYIYFFILISRLSWLNVLSYEIWLTIGNPGISFGKSKRALLKRKLCYAAYAILVPALTAVVFITAHQGLHPFPKSVQPYIDVYHCAIDDKGPDNYGYIYLYIPACILTVINLVLFVKTLTHFLTIRNTMKRITDNTSQHKQNMAKANKRRATIILKLGLIMGVTSMYYLFGYSRKLADHPVLNVIGDILMFINIFEGIYFLIIFVVRWRYIKRLLYKFNILKKHPDNVEDSNSTESVHEMAMHAFK